MLTSDQRKALLWAYQEAVSKREQAASRRRAAETQDRWSRTDLANFKRQEAEHDRYACALRELLATERPVIQWVERPLA